MDFSAILIVPFSAIVAFATLVIWARANRTLPRLIWPCAASTLAAILVFLRPPAPSEIGLWFFALLSLAFSAAIGTVIGSTIARRASKSVRARLRG